MSLIRCLCVLAAFIPTAALAELREVREVSVSGDWEVKIAPDEVVVTLGIDTFDRAPAAARRLNQERVKKVMATVATFKVDPTRVQTEQITIEPRFRKSDSLELDGYTARKQIVICVTDLARFDDLLTALLEAGITDVRGIVFRSTKLETARDEARIGAVKNARAKANAMASELGQKLGRPRSVIENLRSSSEGLAYGRSQGGAVGETFAPGQISVSASVAVKFELAD